jgi:hypothetical protein
MSNRRRKNRQVSIYPNDELKAVAVQEAKLRGQTLSGFFCDGAAALAGKKLMASIPIPKQNAELYGELRSTTANLNQLTYKVHTDQRIDPNNILEETRDVLRQVLDYLINPPEKGDD